MRALRSGILALVGATIPLSFYWAFVRPDRMAAIASAESRLEAKQADIPRLGTIADKLPEFRLEQQALQERLALLDEIRPASRDVGPLLERLRDIASGEGLSQFQVEELPAGKDSPTLPLRLRTQGDPAAVLALLGRLPRLARLLHLERVELERIDSGRYEVVVRLVALRDPTVP
jgi:Tfp pilus assembly protein PilO